MPPAPQSRLARLADLAFRRRRLVLLGWVVALLAAFAASGALAGDFSADYATPGSESKRASDLLAQRFPTRSPDTVDVVWQAPGGVDAVRGRMDAILASAAKLDGIGEVIMFAILFGLSMDYEVFLLSRVREEFLGGLSTSRAVTEGLARTARVITAAALIMVAVFGAFALSPEVFLKLIGIGMAAAILIDATIVRMLLVPAVMQILGDRNWWLPRWLDRLIPAPAPTPQTA